MKFVSHRFLPGSVTSWIVFLVLCSLTLRVHAQVPPPGVATGPTLIASLRSAASATSEQALAVGNAADAWPRRANSSNYRFDLLVSDFRTLQLQFQALRERFNWMANLALQASLRNAANNMAELDAGLNITEELLVFLNDQINAGTLDRMTLVRTCRTFEDVMRLWDREFRRNCSRMGVAI